MPRMTFLYGLGDVAARYGVDESIFLHMVVTLTVNNKDNGRNFQDGRWWTYNSLAAWEEAFPWWSAKQIRRVINSCRDQGALLIGEFNKDHRDRTAWYSPSDEVLAFYREDWSETDKCICPNGQMQMPERADARAQTGTALPKESTKDIPPIVPPGDSAPPKVRKRREVRPEPAWKPERFAKFWAAYPRGEAKQAAIRAWDRLQADDALLDAMAAALARQMHRPDWQEGVGIPYASTWLNGRRWEDEDRTPAREAAPPSDEPRAYHLVLIDGEEVVVYDDQPGPEDQPGG